MWDRLSMLRLFALIVLLTVGEAHAASCPPTTDFELLVTPVRGEVKMNLTTSFAEIERLAGPETAARHYPC